MTTIQTFQNQMLTNPQCKRPQMKEDAEWTLLQKNKRIGMDTFVFKTDSVDAYQMLRACYRSIVERHNATYSEDDFILDRLWDLALFITTDSPQFGAMLSGSVGNGKTTTMLAFQQTLNQFRDWGYIPEDYKGLGIRIVSAKEIVALKDHNFKQYQELCTRPLLGIDDLGAEPAESRSFGNVSTPIIDLLEQRYYYRLFTIVSTNLDFEELTSRYGTRIGDRLLEMMKFIIFGDKNSYRNQLSPLLARE